MKSETAKALLERYEYSKESAIKAVEIAEQELCEKYAADIHKLVERWEKSDDKMDAIHIGEVEKMQAENERLRAEVTTLRTALDEANRRCGGESAERGVCGGCATKVSLPDEIEEMFSIPPTEEINGKKYIALNDAKALFLAVRMGGMALNQYQYYAMETCLPESCNPMYMLFGLAEEVGELCGKFAKAIRKGEIVITDNGIEYTDKCDKEAFIGAVRKEGGDCFWMLFGFCSVMGWTAESIAKGNLDKLAARKQSNTIVSHTDH